MMVGAMAAALAGTVVAAGSLRAAEPVADASMFSPRLGAAYKQQRMRQGEEGPGCTPTIDGDLAYVPRGTARQVDLIAIDPKAARIAAGALKLRHIERRYLSMLLRQDNGTYRYESRLKEVQLSERSLDVAAGGTRSPLDGLVLA